MLVLIGQLSTVIGTLFYKSFGRNVDTRWMVFFALIAIITNNGLDYAFAKRWNL